MNKNMIIIRPGTPPSRENMIIVPGNLTMKKKKSNQSATIQRNKKRVSLVRNPNHHHSNKSNAAYGEGSNDDDKETMEQQLKHAIMQYHKEQLSLPKQINRIKEDMAISTREQPLVGDAETKTTHSPTFFVSPYKNKQVNHDTGGHNLLRLSHPEPIVSASNLSQRDTTSNTHITISKDTFIPPNSKSRIKTSEKLPPIFSQITPRRSKKNNENKLWLGPPNSMPPNKRSEHVAAYKTIALHRKSSGRSSSHSKRSWTEIQQHQRRKQDQENTLDNYQIIIEPGILKTASIPSKHGDDGNESVCSIYSDDTDTFSEGNPPTFRSLKGIDTPMYYASGRESNASSIHVRSMPDMDRTSKRDYTESNFGNYSTKVVLPSAEHSFLDELSVMSSTSIRHKKSVHFAPDVREISRESRAQPLFSGTKSHASPMGLRLPMTYTGSTESVDQLPAVVEKFTIKSLPILPNIIPSALNVNANIIYIKGDGQMHSSNSSAVSLTRRSSSRSVSGSSYRQQFSYRSDEADDEDESVYSKPVKKQIKVALPSTQESFITTTNTPQNNSNSSPTSSQPSSNRVTHKKTAANPPKKAYSTAKKVTFQKTKSTGNSSNGGTSVTSKKSKKPKNGSETSSRTSTNSSSPIQDPDDPEQRLKVYSQAMLAVQARMRELDTKFGSPQKIEIPENVEYRFGKVVVPSARAKDMKSNKGKG